MTVTIIKALIARRPVLSSRVPIKISEVIKFSLFIQILTVTVSQVIEQTKLLTVHLIEHICPSCSFLGQGRKFQLQALCF